LVPDDRSTIWLAETLAEALDARDSYTAGHGIRVGDYAHAIALELGLEAEELESLQIAAQLHDIGKIGIPDAVLRKATPLNDEEFELVKLHPQIGRRILEKAQSFDHLLPVVELHHENFDGIGYQYGLAGDKIPLGARIVRVADSFDAMTTDRAYRRAFAAEDAVREIRACSGRQYDPEMVRAFTRVFERERNAGLMAAGSGRSLWVESEPGVGREPGVESEAGQTPDVHSNQTLYDPQFVHIRRPMPRR
jgi:HD-GYP domain-containing protein (c-di-GMP phosphodiesterase class II)